MGSHVLHRHTVSTCRFRSVSSHWHSMDTCQYLIVFTWSLVHCNWFEVVGGAICGYVWRLPSGCCEILIIPRSIVRSPSTQTIEENKIWNSKPKNNLRRYVRIRTDTHTNASSLFKASRMTATNNNLCCQVHVHRFWINSYAKRTHTSHTPYCTIH